MRRLGLRSAIFAGLLAMGALGLGCFKPDHPACAFSCATPPNTCPTGFVCGGDKLCHDPSSTGSCSIVTDAATDERDGAPESGVASDAGDSGARDGAADAGANDARDASGAGAG